MLESKADDKADAHTVGSCPSTETEEGTTTVHSSTSKADSTEKAGGQLYGVPDLSMVKVLVIRKNSQLNSRNEWPCVPVLVLGNQFQDNFEIFRKHLASLLFKTASLSQQQVEGICDFYFPATGLQVPLSHCVGQYIYYWRTMALNIPFHLIAVLEESVFDTCFGLPQQASPTNQNQTSQKGSGKEQAELQQKFSELELGAGSEFKDLEVEEVNQEVFDAFYGNYPIKVNLRLYADNQNCFLMEGLTTEEGTDFIGGDQVAEFLPHPESCSDITWKDKIEIVRSDGSRERLEDFAVAWWVCQDCKQVFEGGLEEDGDIGDAEENEEEEEEDEDEDNYDKTLLQLVQQESTRLLSGQGGSKLVVMRRHREQTIIDKQRSKEQKSTPKNGKNHKKSSKK